MIGHDGMRSLPDAADRSSSVLNAVLSAMTDRMFRLTRDGTYLDFRSERDEDLYVARDQIVGNNVRNLLPTEVNRTVLHHIALALDNRSIESFEYGLDFPEGRRVFRARVSASGPDEVVLVSREITGALKDVEALRASSERLHALVTSLPGAVIILDLNGIIRFIGGQIAEQGSVSPRDFIGMSVFDTLDHEPLVAGHLSRALKSGSFRERVEFAGATFEARWSPLRDERGEVTAIIGVGLDITARVAAERSRDESEARFKLLMDHSTDVLLDLHDGCIAYISPNCLEAFGLPQSHFRGRRVLDFVHQDDQPAVAKYSAPGGSGLIDTRFRIRNGDGAWSWLEATGARVVDDAGRPRAIQVVRNIDERVRTEVALAESEAKYRNLVEGARDVVFSLDVQGNVTAVNASAVEMFGYTNDELLQMNASQFIDPAYLQLAKDNVRRAKHGDRIDWPLEFLMGAKDGSPRWVEVIADPILTDGLVVGFQGILRDIGERKAAEDRAGLQAQLLDTVRQAVLATGQRHGAITYWNRYAQTLFGYSEAEAIGRTALALFMPESRAVAVAGMARVMAGEHWSGELAARRKDGTIFPALVLGAPLTNASAGVIGAVGVVADLSQLRQAEQQATVAREQAAVLEERSRIAHDLHDNVAQYFFGIGIASKELLERASLSPTALRRKLAHIRRLASEGGREVRRAVNALTDDSLAMDLNVTIEKLAVDLRGAGNIAVESAIDPPAGTLAADVQRELFDAAREAAFNVRKHSTATKVRIELAVGGATVALEVADDGRGRASEIEAAMEERRGYGLRKLRERFERRGGQVQVRDNDEGGVTLRFVLPVRMRR